MPQLDTMLRALADRGAREFFCQEGTTPTLRYPDGDKPVSRSALSRAQIVTLISELGTAGDGGGIRSGAATRFVYTLDDGRAFAIEAGIGEAGFVARIVAQGGMPAGVTETIAPDRHAEIGRAHV